MPLLKKAHKKGKKKKTMMATWSDSDKTSFNEEEKQKRKPIFGILSQFSTKRSPYTRKQGRQDTRFLGLLVRPLLRKVLENF